MSRRDTRKDDQDRNQIEYMVNPAFRDYAIRLAIDIANTAASLMPPPNQKRAANA